MERFFDPHAALDHLQAVRPIDYARTRNHLQGAVTGLSPYITHGVLSMDSFVFGGVAGAA